MNKTERKELKEETFIHTMFAFAFTAVGWFEFTAFFNYQFNCAWIFLWGIFFGLVTLFFWAKAYEGWRKL